MDNYQELEKHFKFLGQELIDEIVKVSVVDDVPKNTELVREGQYIKVVPIVLKGLLKVFIRQEDKDLLLYYIKPNESCVMSFSTGLKRGESIFFVISEEESIVLSIPSDKIAQWVYKYPKINQLFYQQFDQRYLELIDSITHLLSDKLDKRIIYYLMEKATVTRKNPIKISHKEIASELGTAREVVSRIIKKLEKENILIQHSDCIELIGLGDIYHCK
jgi:CRP/FNR family transcriptional regulator